MQTDEADVFLDVSRLLFHHLGDLHDNSRLSIWLISTTKREVWRLHRRRGETPMLTILDWQIEGAQGVGMVTSPAPEEEVLALADQQMGRLGLTQLKSTRCQSRRPPDEEPEKAENEEQPTESL